jgi:hypothetical protein
VEKSGTRTCDRRAVLYSLAPSPSMMVGCSNEARTELSGHGKPATHRLDGQPTYLASLGWTVRQYSINCEKEEVVVGGMFVDEPGGQDRMDKTSIYQIRSATSLGVAFNCKVTRATEATPSNISLLLPICIVSVPLHGIPLRQS